jgi:organic hydroperoxide reductase OsmC/OhrA
MGILSPRISYFPDGKGATSVDIINAGYIHYLSYTGGMKMVKAKVTYVNGMQFVGEADSGHAIVMDGPPETGGKNTGLRPMELLLLGIGSCSGMDVVSILKEKAVRIRS